MSYNQSLFDWDSKFASTEEQWVRKRVQIRTHTETEFDIREEVSVRFDFRSSLSFHLEVEKYQFINKNQSLSIT